MNGQQRTTKDSELNTIYKITPMKEGDNQNYPQKGDNVKVHYVGNEYR